jgi:hypothetical protein
LLRQEELRDFSLQRSFGVAYLNYCQVGKHLLEAFLDQDAVTEALRPQTRLSADTLLWFGQEMAYAELEELEARLAIWWEEAEIGKTFPRHDPASAVGYLPVADLCRCKGDVQGMGEAQIVHMLGGATIHGFKVLSTCPLRSWYYKMMNQCRCFRKVRLFWQQGVVCLRQ